MSGWLLDVNVLLGCGWKNHADHPALLGWLLRGNDWANLWLLIAKPWAAGIAQNPLLQQVKS